MTGAAGACLALYAARRASRVVTKARGHDWGNRSFYAGGAG